MAANGDAGAGARPESPTGSPRSASISLQAAATMNAGLQHEPSRRSSASSQSRNRSSPQSGRRRSTVLMNLQLNDPAVPGPGEMASEQPGGQRASPQLPISGSLSGSPLTADPHHHRTPSLGELHQELEAEQEAHVNRLLVMIRQQQLELQRLQASNPQHAQQPSGEDSSAISERSGQGYSQSPVPHSSIATPVGSFPRSPGIPHPRGSFDAARADLHRPSRTPSRGASPHLRSTSISAESGDWALGGRDESAFYQAETQMLTRENQMLRHRIRDLEKQLSELSTATSGTSDPPVHSSLAQESSAAEDAEP